MRRLVGAAIVAASLAVIGLSVAAADNRRSGFDDMSRESQALQKDDAANPAMLWVAEGRDLWSQRAGGVTQACADCHGAPETMRGAAARYPAFDARLGKALDLQGRINQCRKVHQQAPELAREGREMLSLAALVGLQSRGMPIAAPMDPRLRKTAKHGETIWRRRMGQLNLSCANCHDDNAGRSLAGAPIPQAHPTGYPLYRLEWQEVGSLERRVRNCMIGVRAEPFASGADDLVAVELYLAQRSAGMPIETPAVRP